MKKNYTGLHIIHLRQTHPKPNVRPLWADYQEFSGITKDDLHHVALTNFHKTGKSIDHLKVLGYSQCKVAKYIEQHPSYPVVIEGRTVDAVASFDITRVSGEDAVKYIPSDVMRDEYFQYYQDVFKDGLPEDCSKLSLTEMYTFHDFFGYTAQMLGYTNTTYRAISTEKHEEYSKNNLTHHWYNTLTLRENQAIENAARAAKIHYGKPEGKVIVIFGYGHDFTDNCHKYNCKVTSLSTLPPNISAEKHQEYKNTLKKIFEKDLDINIPELEAFLECVKPIYGEWQPMSPPEKNSAKDSQTLNKFLSQLSSSQDFTPEEFVYITKTLTQILEYVGEVYPDEQEYLHYEQSSTLELIFDCILHPLDCVSKILGDDLPMLDNTLT